MQQYDEMRVSLFLCVVLALAELVLLVYGLQIQQLKFVIVAIVLALVVFMNAFSLRVQITRDDVIISYGIGLLRSVIPRDAIQSVEIAPNQYWTWVYNPFQSHVLRLNLRDGRRVILGVGDPSRMRELLSRR